jgi:putative addiction module killer protein
MIEVLRYLDETGKDVFGEGLQGVRDARARAKISVRAARLAARNFGDCRPLRDGVWELRIDWGPGYRVYYAMAGQLCLLLLCGGDKRTQATDIRCAVEYWNNYKERTAAS